MCKGLRYYTCFYTCTRAAEWHFLDIIVLVVNIQQREGKREVQVLNPKLF